ncbi:hypothetical protein [Pontiella sp.]|uniref:hypothetical protein n=1 Tax=Pontiella sp. TaxID=2837462 RepID=UPI00356726C7
MKRSLLFVLAALALVSAGCGGAASRKASGAADPSPTFMFWCFRKEIVSDDFHVPEMKTEEAATYLQNRMRAVPGYDASSYDLEKNILTVSYQSSTVRKMNFEQAIALAGFQVNLRPANPNSTLTEGIN